MKRNLIVLLIWLLVLTAGCGTQPEEAPSPTEPVTTPKITVPVQIPEPTEPSNMPTEPEVTVEETQAPTESIAVDAVSSATQTDDVSDGMCIVCGMDRGDYDGYCYYCHPDFLFTCVKCGYEQPYHRPESGLCYDCEAAADSVTGATP